ncbi:hypothetical protein VNO78_02796 [Psophocarpus tetragonolobus]|uniref:Uncharacterized protein n=1 Tax=Psophocarpus tetragonolobus TaxID=3891 RepID=A0AAN9XVH6_PSOTE
MTSTRSKKVEAVVLTKKMKAQEVEQRERDMVGGTGYEMEKESRGSMEPCETVLFKKARKVGILIEKGSVDGQYRSNEMYIKVGHDLVNIPYRMEGPGIGNEWATIQGASCTINMDLNGSPKLGEKTHERKEAQGEKDIQEVQQNEWKDSVSTQSYDYKKWVYVGGEEVSRGG